MKELIVNISLIIIWLIAMKYFLTFALPRLIYILMAFLGMFSPQIFWIYLDARDKIRKEIEEKKKQKKSCSLKDLGVWR